MDANSGLSRFRSRSGRVKVVKHGTHPCQKRLNARIEGFKRTIESRKDGGIGFTMPGSYKH